MLPFRGNTAKLPALTKKEELNKMLKNNNSTRDLSKLREYISREKNMLYRDELNRILVAAWNFAVKFDGFDRSDMMKPEFRRHAAEVFELISKQQRGGRKLFVTITASPIEGLDKFYFVFWPTIMGTNSNAVKQIKVFLDGFVKATNLNGDQTENLTSNELTVMESSSTSVPSTESAPFISEDEISSVLLNCLQRDIRKIVLNHAKDVKDLNGFAIGYGGMTDGRLNITVGFLTKEIDSVDVSPRPVERQPKEEKPVIVTANNIPKSESSREPPVTVMEDSDGFIPSEDDENNFDNVVARLMSPKGNKTYQSQLNNLNSDNFHANYQPISGKSPQNKSTPLGLKNKNTNQLRLQHSSINDSSNTSESSNASNTSCLSNVSRSFIRQNAVENSTAAPKATAEATEIIATIERNTAAVANLIENLTNRIEDLEKPQKST